MADESSSYIIQKSSTTYFLSSLFFPPEIKQKVFTLYAFVRTADDFVDDVPQNRTGFYAFKKSYLQALEGKKSGDHIIDEFVALSRQHMFSPKWTEAFLKAMELDLYKQKYKTLKEVCLYMYGSAEVIGLMLANIFGLSAQSYWYARRLGRAMQYINMIRDIAEDVDLGRQYIPTEVLQLYGLPELTKKASSIYSVQYESMIRQEIRRYSVWNRQAVAGLKYISPSERLPVATAATMYQWTAETILKNPTVVWVRKVKPSSWRVFLTALKIWIFSYENSNREVAPTYSVRD